MDISRRGFLAAGALALFANSAHAADYKKLVLSRKPAGYWRLGEAKGPTAHASSTHARHGAYKGTCAFGQPGALHNDKDHAVGLDGKSAFVEVRSSAAFSQPTSGKGLTVEAWLRPDALAFGSGDDPYIHWMGKGDKGKEEWAFRLYSSKAKTRPSRLSAYLFNPEGDLGAGAYFEDKLKAGEWLHVVACFDPGDAGSKGKPGVRIYKNGELRLGPPSPGTLYDNPPKWRIKPAAGDAPVRLGTTHGKGFLHGALDEVAIYPHVLTAKEIKENHEAGMAK